MDIHTFATEIARQHRSDALRAASAHRLARQARPAAAPSDRPMPGHRRGSLRIWRTIPAA